MKANPSFQLYPGDWLRNPGLRACSLAARGLWIDMLCLMHEGYPYGHLRINGHDIVVSTLARMVGSTTREVQRDLFELEKAGVFSRTEGGTIYSRRMVRDETLRRKRAEGGHLSLNHLHVPKKKDGGKDILPPSLDGSFEGSPSSSSSFSFSEEKEKKDCLSVVSPSISVDTAWVKPLRDNPAYKHLDFDAERSKAQDWLAAHPQRQFTKRFFISWLNRAHPPPSASKGESIIAQHLRTLNEMGEEL